MRARRPDAPGGRTNPVKPVADGGLSRLLALQDLDTETDQARHQRATLPERAELSAISDQLAAARSRAEEIGRHRAELQGRQDELDRQLTEADARLAQLDKRMHSGEVTATRDLQAMVEAVGGLETRRRNLEDAELALMEEGEPLDASLAELARETQELTGAKVAAQTRLQVAEEAIDHRLGELGTARQAAAAALEADGAGLLATYERLRSRLGGVGAARLVGGSCSGCHLKLSSSELERIRHLSPGEIATCEQCGRILVPS